MVTAPTDAQVTPRAERVGLSTTVATQLLEEHGPNTVESPPRRGVLRRAARQLIDPMLLLLMGAAFLTIWHHDTADTAVIAAVILLNTAVGVTQELRAERAVAALRDMAAPRARVLRDGTDQLIDAATVVPGDLLLLEAGDVIAADAEVVEAHDLRTDDSALTGESLGISKAAGDELFAGTTVIGGRAQAHVVTTGAGSALGRIASLVASAHPGPTPLQRRLTRLGQQLTVAALTIAGVVMVLAMLRGVSLADAALTAASLAVAAVPESLPAVLTLSLALGAHRMARHAAIARELRAVETLGSVTLLATDKTGTLTQNRMVVEHVWTPADKFEVTGTGYDPTGAITNASGRPAGPDLQRLLRDVVLCNDADVEADPNRLQSWRSIGDPTEAALVVLARRGNLDVGATRAAHPRRREVPFDSQRAWMATSHDGSDGSLVVYKGAPDTLLASCIPGDDVRAATAWAGDRADEGCRVLAVAEGRGDIPDQPSLPPHLELVGLVAMTDPPRAGLEPVLAALSSAGIALVVMTGDHPATAAAVARRLGLRGTVLDARITTSFDGQEAQVYARVRPEHKLALVQAWRRAGEVVAVTGDGVNDGPALRMADIGVAMGKGGTEVARQAADLVLTDDRLETVVHAVEEGRRIHDNLRRFLRYALSGGLAEVLYILGAPLFGIAVPLLPGQILWINMLTHGLPGVAMGAEPSSPGVLSRPPIAREAAIIDRPLAVRVGVTGGLIAAVTTIAALISRDNGGDWRTSAFVVLGLAQLGVGLAIRDRGAARSNRFLSVAVAVAVVLQIAAATIAPLQRLLETQSLPLNVWAVDIALAVVPALALWVARHRGLRRWPPARHHATAMVRGPRSPLLRTPDSERAAPRDVQ
jgi:Ca2+-transporting ATPase